MKNVISPTFMETRAIAIREELEDVYKLDKCHSCRDLPIWMTLTFPQLRHLVGKIQKSKKKNEKKV